MCYKKKSSYICPASNYPEFSSFLVEYVTTNPNQMNSLTLGLTYSVSHTLIFDIDVYGSYISREKLLNYFYSTFLDVLKTHLADILKNFTVILAMRDDYSGGMHIHLPEVEIAHDDYIFLCNQMKSKCNSKNFQTTFKLDCPASMFLVGSRKNGKAKYIPI